MKLQAFAGCLLLFLLAIPVTVLGQDCYKHPKAELMLKDCTGHVETICFDRSCAAKLVTAI